MLGVCVRPGEFRPHWEYVELQFEKSVSYDPEWRFSGPRFGVHAPYYVALGSHKMQKADDAMKRIIETARVGEKLNADIVVARGGFYSKRAAGEVMRDLVERCEKLQDAIRIPLGIETQPRHSQFGSLDEVLELADRIGIIPVINLPAIIAREGEVNLSKVLNLVEKPYIHFDDSINLEELAAALPQKYTLVAEKPEAAELMKTLI